MKSLFPFLVVCLIMIFACKEENTLKPPAKLRLEFPGSVYNDWQSEGHYRSELPNAFVYSIQFNRNSSLKVGDVVQIKGELIKDSRKNILTKLQELNLPSRGVIQELTPKIKIKIDLFEEEIVWNGIKTSVVEFNAQENEIVKISQFEPFDVVEDVNLNFFNGNLKLHYVKFKDSIDLSYLSQMVNNNVESHKFKSDNIEKENKYDSTARRFSSKYRFKGDMATTFQFVTHDSISQLVWGQVLIDFNRFAEDGYPTDSDTKSRIMDRLEQDIDHFIHSLTWEK